MEPEPPGAAFFLPEAGADPIWSKPEPESAPGPRTSGAKADQKSGGSATLLVHRKHVFIGNNDTQ